MKNLILPLFVLLLFGCEKTEEQLPENPYNYVGEAHNEQLHQLRTEHRAALDGIDAPLEVEAYIFQAAFEEGTGMQALRGTKERLGLTQEQTLAQANYANASTLCDVFDFPQPLADIICPTIGRLLAIEGGTQAAQKEIEQVIREAEVKLMSAQEDQEGYPAAMAFLATARHSSQYWLQHRANGKPKWWQVVLADAAGAGIGFLGGGGTAVPLAVGMSTVVAELE